MDRELQMKIIDWIVNDATEEQLEGIEQLAMYCDIPRGLELIVGEDEYQEFIKEIKEEK